jgi:hypothetical protein
LRLATPARPQPQRRPLKTPTPLEPTLFPKLRVHFADFPYLHCSYRAEAVHLGDLMRLSVRHSMKPNSLTNFRGQIFKGRRGRAGRRKKSGALPLPARVSPDNRIPHCAMLVKQKRKLCPAPSPASLPLLASPHPYLCAGILTRFPFAAT